jgi:hypothetical protein
LQSIWLGKHIESWPQTNYAFNNLLPI